MLWFHLTKIDEERPFQEIKESTETELLLLYDDITSSWTKRNREERNRSVLVFSEWMEAYLTYNANTTPDEKYHFVSFMINQHLTHLNRTFNGLTKAEQDVIRALVNRTNHLREANATTLTLLTVSEDHK